VLALMHALNQGEAAGKVVVFFNDGSGDIDVSQRAQLTPPLDIGSLQTFGVLEADRDSGKDVIACSWSGCAFVGPGDLTNYFTKGAERVKGADLNGDGVDDLVFSGPPYAGVRISLGEPRIP